MEDFFSPKLIGWVGSGLSMVSMMPQAYATLKSGKTEGLSLSSFSLLLSGAICWLAYGFVLQDYPIIITNVVMVLTVGAVFCVLVKQRMPIIIARIKNRGTAADIAVSAGDALPPVTEFPKKHRFVRPRRRRKY